MKIDQKEEFQGLKLECPVELDDTISIVIGKNGAGKSRLIQAIAEGKITAKFGEQQITLEQIKSFPNGLQPNISFNFDSLSFRGAQNQVKNLYRTFRGKLHEVRDLGIGQSFPSPVRGGEVHQHAFIQAVRAASTATGKGINDLNEQDVADFYSTATTNQMGVVNLSAITKEYLERQEANERNDFANHKYGKTLPYLTFDDFRKRFGPPPWELFNELLELTFEGKYYVEPPKSGDPEDYRPSIKRTDGRQINPSNFSAGEKTLLWLCLSMYSTVSNFMSGPIKLVLLDEPDSALHPEMIQKLHTALELLVKKFNCAILLTTHSPTTVALSNRENIWQISETSITQIERDCAIASLLEGVDQVSIHYTNRRQVYVESYYDSVIYSKIFSFLRRQKLIKERHISLSFIPASPKLPARNIEQIHDAVFGPTDPEKLSYFISQINGQSNSAQVIGTVECLAKEENQTVHGIIDWDLVNNSNSRIHVHAEGIFYSIENAILNPLTLAFYLLIHFPTKLSVTELGFNEHISVADLLGDINHWQTIADRFTSLVLDEIEDSSEIRCLFGESTMLKFKKRYAHHHGHDLENLIRKRFAFLNQLKQRLIEDVLEKTLCFPGIKIVPNTFLDLFQKIQGNQ